MTLLHPTWGFDMYGPVTRPLMPRILASGVGFVGGYLWDGAKGMTPQSAELLSASGLRVLSYYEAGDQLSGFSADQGKRAAQEAYDIAQSIGQPQGSRIFFAVDLDESAPEEIANIQPYFEALNKELEGEYGVDGYGSGLTLERLIASGLITYSVLGAIGWRDGHAFLPRATVVQKPPSDPYHYGIQVDPLFCQAPMITPFTWTTGTVIAPPVAPAIHPAEQDYTAPLRLGSRGDPVRVLQAMLGVSPVDGVWGSDTEKAVKIFRRAHGLDDGAPLQLELVSELQHKEAAA